MRVAAQKARAKKIPPETRVSHYRVGEVFELTTRSGDRIGFFKWVLISPGWRTFEALVTELGIHGTIPLPGRLAAVRHTFLPDRMFPRGVAHKVNGAAFSCIFANGEEGLVPAADGDYSNWLWLVEVPEV